MTTRSTALVVAKAPVPGLAKTRLAAVIGNDRAADIAAASLLDTLDAVLAANFDRRVVAMTGDLAQASRSAEISAALASYIVVPQRGDGLGERLAGAHADAWLPGHSVLQIGMDTPQVTPELLNRCIAAAAESGTVLGLAEDGGWWALGVDDPAVASALVSVPMSTPDTGTATRNALIEAAGTVRMLETLRDVDYVADLGSVAALCSDGSRFRAAARSTIETL